MSTGKHIDAVCIVIVVLMLLLTVLFMNGEALGIAVIAGEESSDGLFTENDQDGSWSTADAAVITLSDEGSSVRGTGAYVYGNVIYIVCAGRYVVSGELSDGKILVEADGDDKIWLMLDGASIHCSDDAVIRIEQAAKVFLTLKEGTENTLSSGSSYSEEAAAAGVDGTVYSRDDLTINGAGSLSVTAEYQHGIVCNDDLVLVGGDIAVEAAQDGLHANDSIRIKESSIYITAGDDGITVSNDDETASLYMESGNIRIPSCYEGLEAIQVTIAGGTLDIRPTDDGINANGSGGSSAICISGGEITIINEEGRDADGLDSNKDIFISGGSLLISVSGNGSNSAIDYGSENGGVCEITGGTVLACGSSAMAEGFDSSSAQGFLMYNVSGEAGTTVTVKDSDGNELLSETVPCSFSSVVASTPEMRVGDTCTLAVGETETEITIDNSSASGGFGGGGMPGGRGMDADDFRDIDGSDVPALPDGEDGNGFEPGQAGDGFEPGRDGEEALPEQDGKGFEPGQDGEEALPEQDGNETMQGQFGKGAAPGQAGDEAAKEQDGEEGSEALPGEDGERGREPLPKMNR